MAAVLEGRCSLDRMRESWLDSPVSPVLDLSLAEVLLFDSAYSSLPFGMESRVRLLYIGSNVVDGNRLNDGRG